MRGGPAFVAAWATYAGPCVSVDTYPGPGTSTVHDHDLGTPRAGGNPFSSRQALVAALA